MEICAERVEGEEISKTAELGEISALSAEFRPSFSCDAGLDAYSVLLPGSEGL